MSKLLDFAVLGSSGIQQQGGRIEHETHSALRGGRGPKLYAEMRDNDAVVGAILYVARTWLTQVKWYIEPADERNPEAVDWADFVESCRGDMSHTWTDFISEILSMMVFGWSLFEVCYKRRDGVNPDPTRNSAYSDGYIGWRKFSLRSQDTLESWMFDEDMGIRGLVQRLPTGGLVSIPIEKSLLFRTESTANNPEGRSMLRNAVRPYLFVKRIQEYEATGTERDLAGLPTVQVPLELFDTSSEGEVAARNRQVLDQLLTMASSVRRDEREAIVIPCEEDRDGKTGFKFSLLSSGGSRQHNVDTIIRRYESRMAMTLLAEFILLGSDKVGSWSMYSGKTDSFAVSLRSILTNIGEVIQRYAVNRLCAINGCDPDLVPKIRHGDVAAPPLTEIATFVQQMASSGMLMYDKATERWVRAQAGMPEPEDEGLIPPYPEEQPQGMDEESQQTEQDEEAAADMTPAPAAV
jgi:hypothetical protein